MAYQKMINSGKTARNFPSVTPADGSDLPNGECSALFIGTGGNVVCVDDAGNETTFKNLPDAYALPVQTKRVKSTGTTATDIVAYY